MLGREILSEREKKEQNFSARHSSWGKESFYIKSVRWKNNAMAVIDVRQTTTRGKVHGQVRALIVCIMHNIIFFPFFLYCLLPTS